MQAVNHTLTAGIIAVTIKQPALVAPLALASHFVLDSIPHFSGRLAFGHGTKAYYRLIGIDGAVSIVAYLAMVAIWPHLWWAISVGMFFALLPDTLWPLATRVKQRGPLWAFFRFHKGIQWSETPRGAIVEIVYLAGAISVLAALG